MNMDSFYFVMSDDSLDEIAKPGMEQAYDSDKKNCLATDEFSERTPGLFKPELLGTRGVCYLVQDKAGGNKYSCKGVSKKHNDLHFQRVIKRS